MLQMNKDLVRENDEDLPDEQDPKPSASVETRAGRPMAFLLRLRPLDCEFFIGL